MSISDQICRRKGGRAEARGAKSKIQTSNMVDRIVENIDNPRKPQRIRLPNRYEIDWMITQAKEAVVNHPDSVAAKKRLAALLAYKRERFGRR